MEWSVQDRTSTGEKSVTLTYQDLAGRVKQLTKVISAGPEVGLELNIYLNHIQSRMTRQVKDELGEQAIELQRNQPLRSQDMISPSLDDYLEARYYTGQSTSATLLDTNQYWTNSTLTSNYTVTYNSLGGTIIGADPVDPIGREIEVELPLGKRTIVVKKALDGNRLKVNLEDVDKAIEDCKEQFMFNISVRKAERKAEDLLKSFISEVDFRNYKERGYFTVEVNNKVYRIHRDKRKFVDLWEKQDGILVPKNRLCSHTQSREIPHADEALSKLLMVRSGQIEQYSNFHAIDEDMNRLAKSSELILCGN